MSNQITIDTDKLSAEFYQYLQYLGVDESIDVLTLQMVAANVAIYKYALAEWHRAGSPLLEEFENGTQIIRREDSLLRVVRTTSKEAIKSLEQIGVTPQSRKALLGLEVFQNRINLKSLESKAVFAAPKEVNFVELEAGEKEKVMEDKHQLLKSISRNPDKTPRYSIDSAFVHNIFDPELRAIALEDLIKNGTDLNREDLVMEYLSGEILAEEIALENGRVYRRIIDVDQWKPEKVKLFEESGKAIEVYGEIIPLDEAKEQREKRYMVVATTINKIEKATS